jgi:hypothetical protein
MKQLAHGGRTVRAAPERGLVPVPEKRKESGRSLLYSQYQGVGQVNLFRVVKVLKNPFYLDFLPRGLIFP